MTSANKYKLCSISGKFNLSVEIPNLRTYWIQGDTIYTYKQPQRKYFEHKSTAYTFRMYLIYVMWAGPIEQIWPGGHKAPKFDLKIQL